ncbi:MAG: hypothetical protein ABI091_09670 [Ferruginibacter sp.]
MSNLENELDVLEEFMKMKKFNIEAQKNAKVMNQVGSTISANTDMG